MQKLMCVPPDYTDTTGSEDEKRAAKRTPDLMRRVGAAVATGALVVSMCPVSALAEDSVGSSSPANSPSSAQSSTSAQGTASSDSGNDSDTPAAPPSGSAGNAVQAPDGTVPGSSGTAPGGSGTPGSGGANTMTYDYSGSLSGAVNADGSEESVDGQSITATESDQNAALAQNGGTLSIANSELQKSGDDTNGDNCNFYGVNSILLAVGEDTMAKVSNTSLEATSEGSNAIFSTDGATVLAKDVSISTSAGNSRGLDATYDGTILAGSVSATTQGDHCATVATDRGGGSISLVDSTLETNGSGSPLLYSTGNIQVDNVTGTSTNSQIAGMEGLNTILIHDSTLTSTNTSKTASDPVADAIIIYQSTSGDAESTTGEAATFQAVDSTLSSSIESGSFFYLTNTNANLYLQNTQLNYDSSAANLIQVEGNNSNNWGSAGSNGANVTLTAANQELAGNASVDDISTLALYLTDGSTWTGSADITANSSANESSKTDSPITVSIDSGSTWVVTGNSTVSNLNVAEGGTVCDGSGNTVTIVADGQTVVQGTSDYTVTVTGTYSTSYDGSGASQAQADLIDRSDYDDEYATQTSFSMDSDGVNQSQSGDSTESSNSSSAGNQSSSGNSNDSDGSSASSNPIVSFFGSVWSAIAGLFS